MACKETLEFVEVRQSQNKYQPRFFHVCSPFIIFHGDAANNQAQSYIPSREVCHSINWKSNAQSYMVWTVIKEDSS